MKGQGPTDPNLSIQRSPQRRYERMQFDLSMTEGNAKTDKMEQHLKHIV